MSVLKQPPRHHKANKQAKQSDQRICRLCDLIYLHARWIRDGKIERAWREDKKTTFVLCPACRKIKEDVVEGVLIINKEVYGRNPADIDHEIRHIAKMEIARDPLKRILGIAKSRQEIAVYTTRKELATTIGKHIQRSRRGNLKLHFSDHEDFVQIFLRTAPEKRSGPRRKIIR